MHRNTCRTTKRVSALLALVLVPQIALAAPGGDGHASIGQLMTPAINFALYAYLMTLAYKKVIRPALRNRKIEIEQHLQRAASALADSERALQLAERRMEELEDEQAQVIAALNAEGERIAQTVAEKTEQAVRATKTDAVRLINNELDRATAEIRSQVVAFAGVKAREQLQGKISADDDARLRKEALDALFAR